MNALQERHSQLQEKNSRSLGNLQGSTSRLSRQMIETKRIADKTLEQARNISGTPEWLSYLHLTAFVILVCIILIIRKFYPSLWAPGICAAGPVVYRIPKEGRSDSYQSQTTRQRSYALYICRGVNTLKLEVRILNVTILNGTLEIIQLLKSLFKTKEAPLSGSESCLFQRR